MARVHCLRWMDWRTGGGESVAMEACAQGMGAACTSGSTSGWTGTGMGGRVRRGVACLHSGRPLAGRSRVRIRCCARVAGPSGALESAVRRSSLLPFLVPGADERQVILSESMSLGGAEVPSLGLRGRDKYVEAALEWDASCRRYLDGYSVEVTRVASTEAGVLSVQWTATWTPSSLRWLVDLTARMGWERRDYDLYASLEKPSEAFSLMRVVELFATGFRDGYMRIPVARMDGRHTVAYVEREDGVLEVTRVTESLVLAKMAADGRLKNRRAAQDLVYFLLNRRPPAMPSSEWDAAIKSETRFEAVPGMGALDVDGFAGDEQGGERQAQAFSDVSNFIGFATLAMLTFSIVLGYSYWTHILSERQIYEALYMDP